MKTKNPKCRSIAISHIANHCSNIPPSPGGMWSGGGKVSCGMVTGICMIMALLVFVGDSRAIDDDIPFFAGETGLPNVMFIFDNSDSMQDVPYLRKDGNTLRPSWRWRYGVKDEDGDGFIDEKEDGNVDYDYNKYTSADVEVPMPGKIPPPLPRIDGEPASLSSNVTKINRNHYWYLIYDENLDWDAIEAGWPENYRYCKIQIEDPGGGNPQIRTIYGYSKSSKYWYVYRHDNDENYNFDYLAGVDTVDPCYASDSGWCNTYDNSNPFTYTILTGVPGEVTYPYIRTDSNHGVYIRDANVDWSAIDDNTWNTNYANRLLVVTAGTNEGESRRLSWRSTSGKYWAVTPGFPEDSDYTTRYKIVGDPDDDRYASGGNHPASKLFQAKQALNAFLESTEIKHCVKKDEEGNCIEEEYSLNMGFATYMSARIPRVRAKYYRKTSFDINDRCRAYYWRVRDTYSDFYDVNGPEDGYDITVWGTTYDNVAEGDSIDRLYYEGHCNEQTIHYTVTDISPSPTDSLPNRYRIRLSGVYDYYTWLYFDVSDCSECDGYPYPATFNDGDYTWTRAGGCDAEHPPGCVAGGQGWYYQTTYRDTYGDYSITGPDTRRYIDKDTLLVTPDEGYEGSSWTRKDNPDPEAGDYTLVTEAVAETLTDVPINQDGDHGSIESNTFDYSYFRYPGDGTDDRPHAWSYRTTADGYVYRYSTSYASTWGDAIQNDPFFPATVGDERANHAGDDQVVFVNLPAYDDADAHKGDDVSGQNVAKTLNYISLARVHNPYHSSTWSMRYDYTMMPYTGSLAPNVYTALAGKGTPLGASLKNAKEYYESYLDQDVYTQGGCRKNYVILLTDGLETCDGDPVAAAEALNTSLIPDSANSTVKTYVIGFGLDDASKETLDTIAEAGGTTQAYFATDVEELIKVLIEEIWSEIVGDSYTRSAPVVTRILEEGDELKIYYAYFDHPVWRGHLKAYNLNEDGTMGNPVAGWTSDCDEDLENDADAGCEIASQFSRTIYTMDNNGTRIDFSPANLSELKSLVNPDGEDINGNNVTDENADAEAVIEYTIDPGYDNGEYAGTRDPNWPLGDIYHSVPVVVTEPKFNICYKKGYCDEVDDDNVTHDGFTTTWGSRDTIIYVGANDGMLHAINESNGQERWGWVPRCVLGTLHEFKDGHRFTVDLSVKAADIDVSDNCTGTGWKTVLVEGLRKGGNHYFALDVTDPNDPQPMWEITDDNMGKTWSVPSLGYTNINGTATSVVFVGGGYSTTENVGNRVYILKVGTGEILSEIEVGGATNNVPSQILAMRYLLDKQGNPVDYITREKVDSRLKGFIEVAYFGDTDGTLYKITGLNADSGWAPEAEVLYKPENPRPIYHRPAVADVYKNCTRRFVLFGTGDENDPIDGSSQDYFYEIEDRAYDGSENGPDHGSSWTHSQQNDGLFRMTWMSTLPLGEKVFSDPVTYRNVVYFTTYQPQGGCAMGFSYLYGLTTTQCGSEGGEGGLEYGLDDEPLDPHEGKLDLGIGIATSPVIAPPKMYIQIPRGKGGDMEPPVAIQIPVDPGTLLYWREAY